MPAPMKTVFAMNDADGIVKEFLVESYENLDRLDRDLVALEKIPTTARFWQVFSAPSTPLRAPRAFWHSTNWER